MNIKIGKKFGKLTVLHIFFKPSKEGRRIYFECKCDCGVIKSFYKYSITLGNTKSCGCLQSKLSSNRMMKKNPMWMPGIREKSIATNKALGTRPIVRGGNGQEMPIPQRVLLTALGKGWYAEHSVSTGTKGNGMPSCYKIDIANPSKMIGIEVDGFSHSALKRQEQDKKKTIFLVKLGWKVLRFKNKEVMENLQLVLSKIK